jgi:hypothetical protein
MGSINVRNRLWLALAALVVVITPAQPVRAEAVTAVFSKHTAGSSLTVEHGVWDQFLKRYVKRDAAGLNRVDYARFKAKDHKTLKGYVKALQSVDVAKLDRVEQFAFWANLYNAKTVDVVLDHYPVSSIRTITIKSGLLGFLKDSVGLGGPWKAKIIKVAGHELSLDDVEHSILRPVFKDPRLHYAVNCASVGCPNLRMSAFTGANLDAELEAGAKDYINSARGVSITDGKVTASSIYNWFQADFGGDTSGVLAHWRKYAADALKAKLAGVTAINSFQYDWTLNDVKK